ncbi:hypothetical protein TNCV_509711 [Trichonephila clavipes]|nr:hypothetical protein TNCV_509711 [Trichonephila clavipes]
MLGRRIAARPRPPAAVRDLEIALLEEWNSIPQSLIDNLIASMANSFEHHAGYNTIWLGSTQILRENNPGGGQSPCSYFPIHNLTGGLAARRLFRVPSCRKGTKHFEHPCFLRDLSPIPTT